MVDAVNNIGVDINKVVAYDHYKGMLAFICGLGLRKANSLILNIKNTIKYIYNRKDLLSLKLLQPNIYNNAIGFIKITNPHINYHKKLLIEKDSNNNNDSDNEEEERINDNMNDKNKYNILDNTRIHPECYITYDFTPKICADALDEELIYNNYYNNVKNIRKDVINTLYLKFANSSYWIKLWAGYKKPVGK